MSKSSRYTPKYIRYPRALHTITTVYLTVFLCRLSFHPDTSDSLKMIQFTRDTGGPCIDNVDRQRQCLLFIRMPHITTRITAAYQFIKLQLIGYQAGRDPGRCRRVTSEWVFRHHAIFHYDASVYLHHGTSHWHQAASLCTPRYNSLALGFQSIYTKLRLTGIRFPVYLQHGTTHWNQADTGHRCRDTGDGRSQGGLCRSQGYPAVQSRSRCGGQRKSLEICKSHLKNLFRARW